MADAMTHAAADAEALAVALAQGAPSVCAMHDGLASDPGVWRPRPPRPGDVAHNLAGELTWDIDTPLRAVVNRGCLMHRRDADTRLVCGTLLNLPGACYECQPAAGRAAELVLGGWPLDPLLDPEQMAQGLVSWGDVTMEGEARTPFVELAEDARVGDTFLRRAASADDWRPGDELALPVVGVWEEQAAGHLVEYATVASVARWTITLTAPLRYHHLRGRDPATGFELPVHVADLSRSVRVRSLDPAGVRGHVMFTGRGVPITRHVSFEGLGRTTLEATSQVGRYPVHFHLLEWQHLVGVDTSERFVCVGCVIR